MIKTMTRHSITGKILLLLTGILFIVQLPAQTTSDTLRSRNLYRPQTLRQDDVRLNQDSLDSQAQINQDSIDLRLQYIRDSLDARLRFIQDSIIAREKFVRDSIRRREHILDSLTFLRAELPRLLEASLKTYSDNIIVYNKRIQIVGDSILTNYTSKVLPFTIDRPYTPWKSVINLSDKPIKIIIDTIAHKITAIRAPGISNSYSYSARNNILRINSKNSIVSKPGGKLYKVPIDSVFFDRRGNVSKIKRYFHFYQVTNQYHRGAPLFLHLSQVKQFEYSADNVMTKYQTTNFCDRWRAQDEKKVCNIITYSINKQGNTYILTRQTDPVNVYADGWFSYEFDHMGNLKSVAFNNTKNSENWKTIVELNDAGNVSRYIYQNKGAVHKTLLVNYYLNDPGAKYKVETITCIFENDGVSYYQVNNTTDLSRERNRITMEWSPWR